MQSCNKPDVDFKLASKGFTFIKSATIKLPNFLIWFTQK